MGFMTCHRDCTSAFQMLFDEINKHKEEIDRLESKFDTLLAKFMKLELAIDLSTEAPDFEEEENKAKESSHHYKDVMDSFSRMAEKNIMEILKKRRKFLDK